MDEAVFNAIVEAIVKELQAQRQPQELSRSLNPQAAPTAAEKPAAASTVSSGARADLSIDLPDPCLPGRRAKAGVVNPKDADALEALIASTSARIGVGRAGPRIRTASLLLFQADHSLTQDALLRDVDAKLLDELGLFSVQTRITGGKAEYLLRPDLGRQLSDEARKTIAEKCVKTPNIQVCVGDGLSAAAIEANLRQIFPVIKQGVQAAGLSMGTPFFIRYCRVGVMNDIGELLHPDVLVLFVGERPGLGRAESMSAYLAYRPKAGDTDAERDVVCNIFDGGGTNPLEAGAVLVQLAQKMIKHQASGVKLKLAER
jgi:ethanolamine ammonia-lyase small subunit